MEGIVVQAGVVVELLLLLLLGGRNDLLHILAIRGWQHLLVQRAGLLLGLLHLEDVAPYDVDVAAKLLLQVCDLSGRRIKGDGEVGAFPVNHPVFADFVGQGAGSQVLQLPDNAALVQDGLGRSPNHGNQFGLRAVYNSYLLLCNCRWISCATHARQLAEHQC